MHAHIGCTGLGFPPVHWTIVWMIRWMGGELSSVKVDDRRLDHSWWSLISAWWHPSDFSHIRTATIHNLQLTNVHCMHCKTQRNKTFISFIAFESSVEDVYIYSVLHLICYGVGFC